MINLVVQYGLTQTPANHAIVIFLFELVVAALSSWLLAGEAMGLKEWLGGAHDRRGQPVLRAAWRGRSLSAKARRSLEQD